MSDSDNDNGIMDVLGEDISVSEKTDSNQLTFLAWVRVTKGEQTKNPHLKAFAIVGGPTLERALANGNTKVFNDAGRRIVFAIMGALARQTATDRKLVTKLIVNPHDIDSLNSLLAAAKAEAAKAKKQ